MARFALIKTTPVLLGMLALTACPSDDVPQDTEGTSTGEDPTTTMTPTTTPMMTTTDTTVDPDSASGTSESGTTEADPCAGVECDPGQECIGGACFDCGVPLCEPACDEGQACQCPPDDLCCDMGTCGEPVCPLPPVPGNYAECLDPKMGPSDAPCDGAICVSDSDSNPTAAVCVAQDCEASCQCPAAPATGDAVVTCEDVTGDMVNDCWLSCDSGETCPDDMICFAGFICLFGEPGPTIPPYGDCFNAPAGATCDGGGCVQAPDAGVCVQPCGDVGDCAPAPGTGDAPVACGDITGDMMNECILDCSGGETCPDGMVCYMDFVCLWPEIIPPGDNYGDCINNPGSCQPGEDACLGDAAMPTAGACSQSGCADAMDCPVAPATGNAPVACDDFGDGNTCYLDCSMGEVCPDGMVCTDVGMGMNAGQACLWPAQAVIFEEDFEGGMLPAGWTVVDVDGLTPAGGVAFVNDAFVVTDQFEPGMNFGAYSTSWYNPAGQSDDWLITPPIMLGAATSVSWDAWAPDAAFPDGYELRISTAGATPADFLANAALFTIPAEADVFTNHVVDLAAAGYTNQQVYLAWRNTSNDQFILVVDNVTVYE